MRANFYQQLLAEEATRLRAYNRVRNAEHHAAQADIARARIAKRMEQHTNMVKLLFEARRATLLVLCPWGQAPNFAVQNVIM